MTAESERGRLSGAKELIEAHAGSVLSTAGVGFPRLVGERTVGPANEDGHLSNTYPLTPLRWKVARNLAGTIDGRQWAQFRGESTIPPNLKPYMPKQLPDAGVSAVPIEWLYPVDGERSVPVVFWPYGNRLLVGQIPYRHLTDVPEDSDFMWAMRFAGEGRFGAGRLVGRTVTALEVRPVEVIPVSDMPANIPGY